MVDSDVVTMLNAGRGGFEVAVGLQFTRASTEEVACTVPVGPHLTQPYGGVYATVAGEVVARKSAG